MSKVREQNKIAEIAAVSDYEKIASAMRVAATCIDVAGKAVNEEQRQKWITLSRAKVTIASFYLDDLQDER